ncbi:MAG: hypothetical protein AAFV72_12885 [Cyanobacteria bacterium J06635_1]
MNIGKHNSGHFWAMLWRYLNQPLFDKETRTNFNPFEFEHFEQVQFLESCWELNYSSKKHS